jgi:hypothetical protein
MAIIIQKSKIIPGKPILLYGTHSLNVQTVPYKPERREKLLTSLVVLAESLGVYMTGTSPAGGRMLPSGSS